MATLEILHWNDVHGRFAALARLSARARSIREAAGHPVLVFDGGDVEDASVRLSAMTYGVAGWRLLGAARVDAAVVGNGGILRYGPGVLPDYADALGSPPLLCDVTRDGAVPHGAAASRLVSAGDLTVGVIGATDYYPQYDAFGLREEGRVTVVRSQADVLRAAGADVVVLLSHCGIHQDRGISWALRGKVDLIVGGHSHDVLEAGDVDHGVPIAQAGWNGDWLGRITIQLDRDGVRVASMSLEAVSGEAPADQLVIEALASAERDLAAWLAEPVAMLPEAISWSECGDSPVARLVAAALLDAQPGEVGLLIAAQCSAGLPAGRVTRGDVWAATSSPANPATATLTGAQLRSVLIQGLSAEYSATVPRTFRGRPYGRLHMIGVETDGDTFRMNGEPLDESRRYRITASDTELSSYGRLLPADPADLRLYTPTILPEVLESYLRRAYG